MSGFTIYEDYYELITLLPEKEQGELLLSIAKYMFENVEPILNERQNKIFKNLKRPLDISKNNSKRRTKKETKVETEKKPKTKPKKNRKETEEEPKDKPNNKPKENPRKTHQDVDVDVNNKNNITNYLEEIEIGYGEEEEKPLSSIFDFIEENFGRTLSPIELEKIADWEDNELTRYAVEIAVINNVKKINYVEAILQSYKDNGIKSIEEVKDKKRKFKNNNTENVDVELFDYNWLEDEEERE